MYRNTTEKMSFSPGDLMIHQQYMAEAGRMVWEILEYRACEGKYADRGDHAWLAHRASPVSPFATREAALEFLWMEEPSLKRENRLLRAACREMLECTGGSKHWNGETEKALRSIEIALGEEG